MFSWKIEIFDCKSMIRSGFILLHCGESVYEEAIDWLYIGYSAYFEILKSKGILYHYSGH